MFGRAAIRLGIRPHSSFYIFASNEINKIFRVYEPPELNYGFWKIISVLVLIRCEDLSLEIKFFSKVLITRMSFIYIQTMHHWQACLLAYIITLPLLHCTFKQSTSWLAMVLHDTHAQFLFDWLIQVYLQKMVSLCSCVRWQRPKTESERKKLKKTSVNDDK